MHSNDLHSPARRRHAPALTLFLLFLCLCLLVIWLAHLEHTEEESPDTPVDSAVTYGEIITHDAADVERIEVTRENGTWSILRRADGEFTLEGESGWTVSPDIRESLLRAAAVISYEQVLAESPDSYSGSLEQFGLSEPLLIARFSYKDGSTAIIRIGHTSPMPDEKWSYMLVDGDPRLLAVDQGTVDNLNIDRELLHPVEQPVIHKARIDRISWTSNGSAQAVWELRTRVTDADAGLGWYMTVPHVYPADSERMDAMRTNLANLVLGAYVGDATAENLSVYGFTKPRFELTVHMAAAAVNEIAADGTVRPVEQPESTFTLTIGGQKNEYVDYVLYNGSIYLASHFTMAVFMDADPMNTISRYPVVTALADLRSLTVETSKSRDIYRILRIVKTDENGQEMQDENGQPIYENRCLLNEEEFPYETFEAAYMRLENVTVSGTLPEDSSPSSPHTTYIFESEEGRIHTIALSELDPLHDVVTADGYSLFYIIKDGMKLF